MILSLYVYGRPYTLSVTYLMDPTTLTNALKAARVPVKPFVVRELANGGGDGWQQRQGSAIRKAHTVTDWQVVLAFFINGRIEVTEATVLPATSPARGGMQSAQA